MTEQTMTEAEARAILEREEQTRKNMSAAQRKRREKVKQARALLGGAK
jgi:transcriptional regulator